MIYLPKKPITVTRYKPGQDVNDEGKVINIVDKTFDTEAVVLPYSDHLKHDPTSFNRKTGIELFSEVPIYGADIRTNQPPNRVLFEGREFDVVKVKPYDTHYEVICIEVDEYPTPTKSINQCAEREHE